MNKPTKLRAAVLAMGLFLAASAITLHAAAALSANDLKEILENYDAQFMASLRIELDVVEPTHAEPIHGKCRETVIIASDAAGKQLDLTRTDVDPVKYVKTQYNLPARDGKGGDEFLLCYDKHVAMSQKTGLWSIRHDAESIGVGSDNRISRPASMAAPNLDLFPGVNQDAANLYYRYILPLGRGYAQLIDKITSISIDAAGIATVTAAGSLFSPYSGVWNLEIDTKAGYLVRKAAFVQNGAKRQGLVCTASKPRAGALQVFTEGVLTLGQDFQISTKLRSLSFDQEEVRFSKSKMQDATTSETLPAGATIMDFRSVDGDMMPKVQRVKKQTAS